MRQSVHAASTLEWGRPSRGLAGRLVRDLLRRSDRADDAVDVDLGRAVPAVRAGGVEEGRPRAARDCLNAELQLRNIPKYCGCLENLRAISISESGRTNEK